MKQLLSYMQTNVRLVVNIQVVDGNAKTDVSNRREPGSFCGEAEQPQTFISETSYVKVVFHTDNFTDQVSRASTSTAAVKRAML